MTGSDKPAVALQAPLALLALLSLGGGLGCTEQLHLPPGVVAGSGGVGGSQSGNPRGGGGGSAGGGGSGGMAAMPDAEGAGSRVVPKPTSDAADLGMATAEPDAATSCSFLNGVSQQVPQVMVTLDRSASMWKRYGTSTSTRLEWTQATLKKLMRSHQEAVRFGYVEFPVKECQSNVCCASRPIPINPRSVAVIERLWSTCAMPGATCGESTDNSPVAQALAQSSWYFSGPGASVGSRSRHVLLLTDSEPGCAANVDRDDCNLAINEVSMLSANHGVSTKVVALSEDLANSLCLERMATLGTVGAPAAGHVVASGAERLHTDLNDWLKKLEREACQFRLPSTLNPMESIKVAFNDNPVPHDPNRLNGWEFNSLNLPSRLIFYGSACDEILAQGREPLDFFLCRL